MSFTASPFQLAGKAIVLVVLLFEISRDRSRSGEKPQEQKQSPYRACRLLLTLVVIAPACAYRCANGDKNTNRLSDDLRLQPRAAFATVRTNRGAGNCEIDFCFSPSCP
jgi:hypothetical protein